MSSASDEPVTHTDGLVPPHPLYYTVTAERASDSHVNARFTAMSHDRNMTRSPFASCTQTAECGMQTSFGNGGVEMSVVMAINLRLAGGWGVGGGEDVRRTHFFRACCSVRVFFLSVQYF